MTAAEQQQKFGATVESRDGRVILKTGAEAVILTPPEAKRFAFELVGAYMNAAGRNDRGQLMTPEDAERAELHARQITIDEALAA